MQIGNQFIAYMQSLQTRNTLMIPEKTAKNLIDFLAIAALALIVMSPEVVMAAGTPWENAATGILNVFQNGLSQTLATIAVIALGIMAAAGKLEWGTAIKVIVGIVLIFGSAKIVEWIKSISAVA